MRRNIKKMSLEKIDFSKYIKEGLEMAKNNPIKIKPICAKWVKKLISAKEWMNHYSQYSSYCFLSKDKEGVWVSFVVANTIPRDCLELTDEECLQTDDYRKAYNLYPRPLTDLGKKATYSSAGETDH